MKLGVLIPTRGDRSKFLSQAKNLLSKQTLKPDEINIVDFKPSDEKKDITKRYRIGCEQLFNEKKCDLVISIPISATTESLNASVATAIALFWVDQARRKG